MSKLPPPLVYQEVFLPDITAMLASATEPLGNIVPWDKNICHCLLTPILSFNLTRSLSTQANHLDFIKPSNYLLLWYKYLLLCIIIKIPNVCRQLVVLSPGVTQLKTS